MERRITSRKDPLEELAGQILSLSYSDMKRFADVLSACNGAPNMADRLVATAKRFVRKDD